MLGTDVKPQARFKAVRTVLKPVVAFAHYSSTGRRHGSGVRFPSADKRASGVIRTSTSASALYCSCNHIN